MEEQKARDYQKARDIYARYSKLMVWARNRYKDSTGAIYTYHGNVPTRYTLICLAAWSRCVERLGKLESQA
jgi:hypothetical protein